MANSADPLQRSIRKKNPELLIVTSLFHDCPFIHSFHLRRSSRPMPGKRTKGAEHVWRNRQCVCSPRGLRSKERNSSKILFPSAPGSRLSSDSVQYLVTKYAAVAGKNCP